MKKELIVALKGELYIVKFIINPKEDDVEPEVIFGRSFMRLVNGIVDFGSGVITVYPKQDPFEDDSEKTKKSMDDWDQYWTSSSTGRHLTKKEAEKEALALRISQKFALLEEDKVELVGMIVKEEEEAINKVKCEALKEKDNPRAFIFPIRLEGKVNKNALSDTGLDINTMPYRIYEQLGREEIKKVDRGIIMINHTQAKAMGILTNVLFQSDSDDEEEYEIKRNKFGAPIYGPKPAAYLNYNDSAKRSLALQAVINLFQKISVWKKATIGGNDDVAGSSRSKHSRQYETMEEDILNGMGCDGEIDDILRIKLREAESNKEIFTSVVWIRDFNIKEPIYLELCHEFYSTYEFDEVCANDELQTKKIIKFRLGGHAYSLTLLEFARRLGLYHAKELDEDGFDVEKTGTQRESQICYGQFITKIARKARVLNDVVLRSLSALIYCIDLDTTTLRELIDSEGRLILEDPQPSVPRVGITRPPRASKKDLYKRMCNMEIRQGAIKRIPSRQSVSNDKRMLEYFKHKGRWINM
ncbi:hypothetical protein Tco_1155299 [Tanacetum coccineum]